MRKLILLLACLWAVPASAVPILPDDYDTLVLGGLVLSTSDPFSTASPPPLIMGTLDSSVYFDGAFYTYVNVVTPTGDDNSHLNTAFAPGGFTGSMGWSFGDASSAGGTGTALDFLTANVNGRLHWLALDRTMGDHWDAAEPIAFFFRSTRPPTVGDYNLLNSEAGTAEGLAPVPEPGTLMLVSAGLIALGARHRRKKQALS